MEAIASNLYQNGSPRDYALFVVGLNFALRISDLLKLKVKRVRDENHHIKDQVYLRESKTNKEITIKVNESVEEALFYYFTQENLARDDWLFPSNTNPSKHLHRGTAWQMLKRWAQKAGVEERIGTHSFRKTWGYHARQSGVDISVIQHRFNHSDPQTTLRYIGVIEEEVWKAEEKVGEYLGI